MTRIKKEVENFKSFFYALTALAIEHSVKEVHDQTICPFCWMEVNPE